MLNNFSTFIFYCVRLRREIFVQFSKLAILLQFSQFVIAFSFKKFFLGGRRGEEGRLKSKTYLRTHFLLLKKVIFGLCNSAGIFYRHRRADTGAGKEEGEVAFAAAATVVVWRIYSTTSNIFGQILLWRVEVTGGKEREGVRKKGSIIQFLALIGWRLSTPLYATLERKFYRPLLPLI